MAAGAERRAEPALRGPIDRLTAGLPKPWRTIVDWGLTIAIAVAAVLLVKAFVVNPYKIPSASMEPTFHCAESSGQGCMGNYNDRVIANRFIYHFRDPKRGDIVVFDPPADVVSACGAGGTYVKRIIGLPGDEISQRDGVVFIDGEALDEPYLEPGREGGPDFGPLTLGPGPVLHDGRQPPALLRQPPLGADLTRADDRAGVHDLLATEPNQLQLGFPVAPARRAFLMSNVIESIERRQLREVPQFKAGDTVRVHFQVIEGQRRRVQVFEGTVIKRQGPGARETFTVRKQSFGVGVERTFPVHSPKIEKIEVRSIGDVNRAKLYYLRSKVGKKARVREKQVR